MEPKSEVKPMSEKAKKDIIQALQSNRLMRFLDDDQQAQLVSLMSLRDFDAGEVIVKEGDKGDFFWVLDHGVVDIILGDNVVSTFGKGKSFGEQGIVYGTLRSGSAVAKTQVSLWGISAADFEKVLKSSPKQRAVFESFASIRDGDEPAMNFQDFVKALGVDSSAERVHAGISKSRLQQLFQLADRDRSGTLRFDEYSRFLMLLSKPEPEFDIAFILFDQNRNGLVDKDSFVKVMKDKKLFKSDVDFMVDCDLVRRYFGADGKRKLRFIEFTQFFVELQHEVLRQAFLKAANKEMFASMEAVTGILQNVGQSTVPHSLIARLKDMSTLHSTASGGKVSLAEFCALLSLLDRSTGVLATLKSAQTVTKGAGLDRDAFMTAAAATGLVNMSPLEVDVLFAIADKHNTGRITAGDLLGTLRPVAEEVEAEMVRSESTSDPVAKLSGSARALAQIVIAIKHFALGAVAGGIGSFAVYPIDLVKTRMQNQRTSKAAPGAVQLYRNSFDCFAKVLKAEGVRGLYRGIGPQLLGVAPEKAIKLTVNDMFRSAFSDPTKGGAIYWPLEVLAGAAAGGSQVIFTNPVEIVKIRLQVQGESVRLHGAVPKSALTICKELGFAGLYKGASACFLRDIPFSAIYFPVYVQAKTWVGGEGGQLDWKQIMLAGAIAGAPAASLVTPADVIKTRLQVEARKGEATYKGIADCFKKVLADEGPTAFFKGAGARVFRSSPQFGVTLMAYELFHQWLTPDLEARPPTNAPIAPEDIPSLSEGSVAKKLRGIDEKLSRLRA